MYLAPLILESDGMDALNSVARAYLRARVPACKIAGTAHSLSAKHLAPSRPTSCTFETDVSQITPNIHPPLILTPGRNENLF